MRNVFLLLFLVLFPIMFFIRAPAISHFAFAPDVLESMPEQPLYGSQTVILKTADELNLHSLYFSVKNTTLTTAGKVVLYLHGNAGHLFDRVAAAHDLREQGINVLLIDYRGFGLSEGHISEAGFYLDVEAALTWLKGPGGYKAKDIIVLGRSIGSVAAMKLAVDEDISAVILISPIANASAMAKAMGLGWLSPFAYSALDNIARAKKLQKPLLVVHGDKDKMVPQQQGLAVFNSAAVAKHKKQFISVAGANHHNVRLVAGEKYWPWLMGFIRQHSL
ncbi:MAG: alpha/beta hydrolase [Pseudomonadales bacterium]|nr:alpha/beta hydrolase [Pseudomonadales bacterium]